ncbi:MAG: cob(I)yrinic acid a,c-diamide adenosyltransferase [bacterium]|jgi:cob(I)alamin adenosyltransferase
MKIYTCFGDQGKTKLISGEIVDKNDKLIIAYGSIDKLISFLSFIISFYKEFYSFIIKNKYKLKKIEVIIELLNDIQLLLFDLSTDLACTNLNEDQIKNLKIKRIDLEDIKNLEKIIDRIMERVYKIDSFVIPANNVLSSMIHYLRTLVRESEAKIIDCLPYYKINPNILLFVNRLSDLFFAIALYLEIILNNNIKLLKEFKQREIFKNFFENF